MMRRSTKGLVVEHGTFVEYTLLALNKSLEATP